MTVQKFPEEPLPENKSLLNRQSRNALKQLKAPANPYHLYSLQLGEVALERGLYVARGSALLDSIHLMYGWPVADAERYLERNAQGEEIDLYPKTPGNAPNPEDLAAAILGEIEHKLSVRSASGYPKTHPSYLLKE